MEPREPKPAVVVKTPTSMNIAIILLSACTGVMVFLMHNMVERMLKVEATLRDLNLVRPVARVGGMDGRTTAPPTADGRYCDSDYDEFPEEEEVRAVVSNHGRVEEIEQFTPPPTPTSAAEAAPPPSAATPQAEAAPTPSAATSAAEAVPPPSAATPQAEAAPPPSAADTDEDEAPPPSALTTETL